MITLLDIAAAVAVLLGTDDVYAGCIDSTKEKQVGVYIRAPSQPRQCIGRSETFQTARVCFLIHWTTNPTETERAAHTLSQTLSEARNVTAGEHIILWVEPKGTNPIGRDEKGICEAVVDADIYYLMHNA